MSFSGEGRYPFLGREKFGAGRFLSGAGLPSGAGQGQAYTSLVRPSGIPGGSGLSYGAPYLQMLADAQAAQTAQAAADLAAAFGAEAPPGGGGHAGGGK